MEVIQIDTSSIPQLDTKAREDWFWDNLDRLVQANVNMASEIGLLKAQVETRDVIIEKARQEQLRNSEDIINMGKLINQANERAASSVQEYIAQKET